MREEPLEREARVRLSDLGELYARYAPEGVRLAYLLTGDQGEAEDLVQEAFLRMVGRLQFLREPEASRAYLRRTIVNLSKNHFRRRSVERSYVQRQAGAPPLEAADADVTTRAVMRSALLSLPPRQRCAVVLRYYEDLSDSQIADILRCRPGTVRSLISRAVSALRGAPEVIT